jgi:YesN/AraC family two-component response regulator
MKLVAAPLQVESKVFGILIVARRHNHAIEQDESFAVVITDLGMPYVDGVRMPMPAL